MAIYADQFAQEDAMEGIDTYVYEELSYNYNCFNKRQERFADRAVRQAITNGFDRQT